MSLTNGKITLQPCLEEGSVSTSDILEVWQELSPFSVEAILANNPTCFDFAYQCLFCATIVHHVPQSETESQPPEEEAIFDFDADEAPPVGKRQSGMNNLYPRLVELQDRYSHSAPSSGGSGSNNDSNFDGEIREWVIDPWDPSDPSHSLAEHPQVEEKGPLRLIPVTVGMVYVISTTMQSEVSIGIAVRPQERRQGIARQALTLLLPWIFDDLGCHRVQALIIDGPSYYPAHMLFASLGFSHEGTHRRVIMSSALSDWRDVTHMAMLDTEWFTRKSAKLQSKPMTIWDEMLKRHQQELDALLQWEDKQHKLRKTASTETIKHAGDAELLLTDDETKSVASSACLSVDPDESAPPSPTSSVFSWSDAESVSSNTPLVKGKKTGKKKGKRTKRRQSADAHGSSYSSWDSASNASSDWEVT